MTEGFFYQFGLAVEQQKKELDTYINEYQTTQFRNIMKNYREHKQEISIEDYVRASVGIMLNSLLMTRIDGKAAEGFIPSSSTDYRYDVENNILKIWWKVFPVDSISPVELKYEYKIEDYYESNN